MSKFYVSYFYQVRFFNKRIIPFSTALWDPKWFHNFENQDFTFKDKHQVYNGIRAEFLHPDPSNNECVNCNIKDPKICSFMKNYKEQLNRLDFTDVIRYLEEVANNIYKYESIAGEPEIVLLVHEAPDNPCSERWALKEWFRENGIELLEWQKEG